MIKGAVAVALLLGYSSAVSPVQKVLEMMDEMKAKCVKGKQEEVVTFTKFQAFCQDTAKEKLKAIADAKESIAQLSADIMTYDSDATVLAEEIAKLDESIAAAESNLAAAQGQRDKEKADFTALLGEYESNIADLQGATSKIQTMMSSVKSASAASLIQLIPAKTQVKDMIKAFFDLPENKVKALLDTGNGQDPATPVYESQAGGVVELMKNLEKKLVSEKTELQQQEAKSVGAFNMIAQTLNDQISSQTSTRDKKLADKQAAEKSSAMSAGQKADTSAALASDEEYLKDLQMDCAEKAKEFEAKQKLRAGELEALNKAIGIISGPAVTKVGFVQKKHRASALVQLRSSGSAPTQQRVQAYLLAAGQKLNSNILSALAMRVSQDPLAKVKKMIQDMVYKLMEEANEEAEHKGFCDTEMGTNKNTRDAKSSKVEELTASIKEMTADAEMLTSEAAGLTDEVLALDTAVSEASALRSSESAKNKQTISDAVAAKEATQAALKVLKDFYGGAASLIQTSAKTNTKTKGAEAILGMLEVILSDFERLESETTNDEATGADSHEKFLIESKKSKAVMNTDIKHKQNEVTRLTSETAEAKKELKLTQEELDAALEYFEKLKPSCVSAGESYEERVARRKAEIESLSDALEILENKQ